MINEIDLYYWRKDGYDKEFALTYMHLCLLFRILLKEYRIKSYKKIVIRLIEPAILYINDIRIERDTSKALLNVVEIWCDFNLDSFLEKSADDRKEIVWEILARSIKLIALQNNQAINIIVEAYLLGVRQNLKCEFYLSDKLNNEILDISVRLKVKCDEQTVKFFVTKTTISGNAIACQELVRFPIQGGYDKVFNVKKVKWQNDNFIVSFKDGDSYVAKV